LVGTPPSFIGFGFVAAFAGAAFLAAAFLTDDFFAVAINSFLNVQLLLICSAYLP
jgi:hypothetical protein